MPKTFTIQQVHRETGISPSALRIWERRYHWPEPKRGENGYRRYTFRQVADLKLVAALLAKGKRVGEVICEGGPKILRPPTKKKRPPPLDFSQVLAPQTEEGRRLRSRLENAILVGDLGAIDQIKAQLPLLHPLDRGPAVLEVLTLMEAARRSKGISPGS